MRLNVGTPLLRVVIDLLVNIRLVVIFFTFLLSEASLIKFDLFYLFLFLSGFSFTYILDSQDYCGWQRLF